LGTQRIAIACVNCYKAKAKCDRRHPCDRCEARGLSCVSRPPRRSKAATSDGSVPIPSTPVGLTTQSEGNSDGASRSSANFFNKATIIDQGATASTGVQESLQKSHQGRTDDLELHSTAASEPDTNQQQPGQDQANNGSPFTPHQSNSSSNPELFEGHQASINADRNDLCQPLPDTAASETHSITSYTGWRSPPPPTRTLQSPPVPSPIITSELPAWQTATELRAWEFGDVPRSSGMEDSTAPPHINASECGTGLFSLEALTNDPQQIMSSSFMGHNDGFSQSFDTSNIPGGNGATPHLPSLGQMSVDNADNEGIRVRDWEHWSICQCTPPPLTAAPARAKTVVANLDENFRDPGVWSSSPEDWRDKHFEPAELFANIHITETTREWVLVIAQRFMRVAMDSHGLTLDSPLPSSQDREKGQLSTGSLRLPPTKSLHTYLELFLRNFEPFYPLLPARSLDPNKLANSNNSKGLILLLLLMLAFGSMLDPACKARRFSTALTEICRLSMTDVLEKDSGAARSGLFLYCALIFTIKGAFSGDKWHMNIGITHRHIYLTVSLIHV
jgi:hypothetical protein